MSHTVVTSSTQRQAMRNAGQLASLTLDYLSDFVKEGITTQELNTLCHDFIIKHGGYPAPLQEGFPGSVCISLNEEVCHGVPGPKCLKKGDILNIDVSLELKGWYGDTSRMFSIPPIPPQARILIETTHTALQKGMAEVGPGKHLGDIGAAIEACARERNFSVVQDYCGHGIGQVLHGAPQVLHYGTYGTGLKLKEGMCFTIEPMINVGKAQTKVLSDQWTVVTKDRRLSAQWEHTLRVTAHGFEIFTLSS